MPSPHKQPFPSYKETRNPWQPTGAAPDTAPIAQTWLCTPHAPSPSDDLRHPPRPLSMEPGPHRCTHAPNPMHHHVLMCPGPSSHAPATLDMPRPTPHTSVCTCMGSVTGMHPCMSAPPSLPRYRPMCPNPSRYTLPSPDMSHVPLTCPSSSHNLRHVLWHPSTCSGAYRPTLQLTNVP